MKKEQIVDYVDFLKLLEINAGLAVDLKGSGIAGLHQFNDVVSHFIGINGFPPSSIYVSEYDVKEFVLTLKGTFNDLIAYRSDRHDNVLPSRIWLQGKFRNMTVIICIAGCSEVTEKNGDKKIVADYGVIAYNPEHEEALFDTLNKLRRTKIVGGLDSFLKPHIKLLSLNSDGQLDTVSIEIDGYEIEAEDLDLNYGKDFSVDFHNPLIEVLTGTTKGIVLLHGPPGTGKTNYIRKIIRDLSGGNKEIIFMPKGLLSQIGTPGFNQFMVANMTNKETVLILEDAESVLCEREQSGDDGSNIVSTILNITDGIMNDLFPVQIIGTFNTNLERIDKALLRSGRLVARRLFDKLSADDASKLLSKIKREDIRVDDPMTLADIYAKNSSVVGVDVPKKKKKVGFGS